MDASACRALCDALDRRLTSAGWARKDTTRASVRFERNRSQVALGTSGDTAVSWSVFPTIPAADLYPGVVFTRPSPAPLVSFTVDEGGGGLQVYRHTVDRAGKLTKEPFFTGDEAQVFARLCDETDRYVEHFVRNVESPARS